MADGPAIQASSLRALKSGATLRRLFKMVAKFRAVENNDTPLVLMVITNLSIIMAMSFVRDAKAGALMG